MPFTQVPAAGGSSSLHISTEPPVTGDIQLIAGSNITITQDTVNGTFTVAATGELSSTLTNGHILVGNASNVATDVAMSGAVAITNAGVTSLAAASVTGALLTGYTSGAGTVAGTDTILQGINKLNGNDALKLPLAGGTVTGVTTFNKAQALNVYTLATSGTITPDGTLGPTFYIAVAGAVTLNGPSGGVDGQKVTFRILNDASHSVTLATGSGNFRFGTDITSYTNSVSLTDYLGAIWNNAASRWDVVSIIQGF